LFNEHHSFCENSGAFLLGTLFALDTARGENQVDGPNATGRSLLPSARIKTKGIALERVKVVARYANGDVIKGFTQNFFPTKERFHLFPVETPSGDAIEVCVRHLKAVFVVRDFWGNPQYNEHKLFIETEQPSGKKVEIVFEDGEVMVGTTLAFDRNRPGFFIFPADSKSNNIRVFVVSSATKGIRQL